MKNPDLFYSWSCVYKICQTNAKTKESLKGKGEYFTSDGNYEGYRLKETLTIFKLSTWNIKAYKNNGINKVEPCVIMNYFKQS